MDERLDEKLPKIEYLERVSSTNDVARERARDGAPHGYAVRADGQRAGRGRRGHPWMSPEGGLYLSIVLRPRVPARVLPGLPAACGLGAARALRGLGCTSLRLKWPNDLVVEAKKLGGVLVETGHGDDGMFAVCGIGINYQAAGERYAGSLTAAGLRDYLPRASLPAAPELARIVRAGVVDMVDRWQFHVLDAGSSARPLTGIVDAYNKVLAFAGGPVCVFSSDNTLRSSGLLHGVDEDGRAVLEYKDGSREAFDAAQVSLRPVSAPPKPF